MNIVLIGMPGAGKSTVGVLLAKALGMQFTDTDLLLQSEGNGKLAEIIAREGIERFLALEESVICSLACENTIIATGGSVVLRPDAMEHLATMGPCVYLHADCSLLEQRAGEISGRGVVFSDGQTFADIYNMRCPLYERYATITVDAQKAQAEVMQEILQKLSARQ